MTILLVLVVFKGSQIEWYIINRLGFLETITNLSLRFFFNWSNLNFSKIPDYTNQSFEFTFFFVGGGGPIFSPLYYKCLCRFTLGFDILIIGIYVEIPFFMFQLNSNYYTLHDLIFWILSLYTITIYNNLTYLGGGS